MGFLCFVICFNLFIFCWLVDWFVNWLVGLLVGLLVYLICLLVAVFGFLINLSLMCSLHRGPLLFSTCTMFKNNENLKERPFDKELL